MVEEDLKWIKETLNGKVDSFGHIVNKYKNFCFNLAFQILKQRELAEDITQDSFIKAFESLNNYKAEAKFSSWLYTIVYRQSLNGLRNIKKNYEILIPNYEVSIEHNIELEEKKKKIRRLLNSLKSEEAVVLTLFYLEELSIKEIQQITAQSESNIKIHLHRGRKNLFKLFIENNLHE